MDLLGQISHVANSTIVLVAIRSRKQVGVTRGGPSQIRPAVDSRKQVLLEARANPCGVGDAATDVERVASAARGRSHTRNV